MKKCESEIIKVEGYVVPFQNYSCPHVYNPRTKTFYLFGGATIDGDDTTVLSHCYEFKIDERCWKRIPDLPFSIGGATAVLYDDNTIFMVGGAEKNTNSRSSFFHDIFEYNIEKRTWSILQLTGTNLLSHFNLIKPCVVVIGSKLYIFCCTYENDGDIFFMSPQREPLIVLDLKTKILTSENQYGKPQLLANTEKVGFCKYLERYIYIFGGQVKPKRNVNDEYQYLKGEFRRFDVVEKRWERVKYGGKSPVNQLCLHMFVVNDLILCFGGMTFDEKTEDYVLNTNNCRIYTFNIKNGFWSYIILEPPIYDRIGDSCALIGSSFLSFGGFSFEENGIWDDSLTKNCHQIFSIDLKDCIPDFVNQNDRYERLEFLKNMMLNMSNSRNGWDFLEIRFFSFFQEDNQCTIFVFKCIL